MPYAVNVSAGEVSNSVSPFMGLAEVLGRFIGGLLDGQPADLEVIYQGELAGAGTKILTLCALKGLLGATGHEGVSFVNAPQLADEHYAHLQRVVLRRVRGVREPHHRALGRTHGRGHA